MIFFRKNHYPVYGTLSILKQLSISVLVVLVWQLTLNIPEILANTESYRIMSNGYPTTGCVHLFLHIPERIFFDKPEYGIKLGNITFFLFSLCSFHFSLCRYGYPLFSYLATFLIGSSPFLLEEVYVRENIFSWPLVSTILVISLLVLSKTFEKSKLLAAFFVCSAFFFVGIASLIRGDCKALIVPCILYSIFFFSYKIYFKCIILILSLVIFYLSSHIPNFLTYSKKGVFNQGYTSHTLAFPLWLGVGDFDNKYGILFHDSVGHSFGKKIHFDKTGNSFGHELMPSYDAVFYTDFLKKIINDPFWYLEILSKRFVKILTTFVPPFLAIYKYKLQIPYPAWLNSLLFISILTYLVIKRHPLWLVISISCFSSMTAFIIFSGSNHTSYTLVHLLMLSFSIVVFKNMVWENWRKIFIK